MEKTTKQIKHLHGPTAALQSAIANLEQFSRKNETSSIVHVADLNVHEGQLIDAANPSMQKTTSLARCFITALFSSKARSQYYQKKVAVQDAILSAIDVIKRNYILIERLKIGTPEEQKLAATTLDVINRYNAVLDQEKKSPDDWGNRLSRFFTKFAGLSVDDDLRDNRIDLPRSQFTSALAVPQVEAGNGMRQKISLAFQHHIKAEHSREEQTGFTAVRLTDVIADPLSQKEADLLRMKAHTLLRHQGIRFGSMAEMLLEIKEAPIETTVDANTGIAHLTLKLTLLPGTVAEVQGAFQRNSQAHSNPIPGSFQLAMHSAQTGFPAPMQYDGWALGDALTAHYPHRLDQMPLFKTLYMRKQEAIAKLVPGEPWFEHARQLWKQKKQVLSKNLLQLHKRLNLAMMQAANGYKPYPEGEKAIIAFFDVVERHPSAANYLSATYQTINDYMIVRPSALLHELWLARPEQDPKAARKEFLDALKEDWAAVQQTLENEIARASVDFEKAALNYVQIMGTLLHQPVQSILLQYFSETLRCAPPLLSDFEQKLQAAALQQLSTYLDELEKPEYCGEFLHNPAAMEQRMHQLLLSDIALFQDEDFDNLETPVKPMVHELEVYFNSRHTMNADQSAEKNWA